MDFIKRKFSISKNLFPNQKGFSLIELILYLGILSLLVGALSVLFGSILDVQLDSAATSGVDQDVRYIQAKLAYDFDSGEPVVIELPASPGASGSSLRINLNNAATDSTYALSGGNLTLTTAEGTFNLNSADTSVTNFTVTRVGSGGDNDTVRVNYTVTSRIQEVSGTESRTVQTTFAGRNNTN